MSTPIDITSALVLSAALAIIAFSPAPEKTSTLAKIETSATHIDKTVQKMRLTLDRIEAKQDSR